MGVTILAARDLHGVFDAHPWPQTLIGSKGLLLILGMREQLRDMMKYAKGA
jgi:hypothetical protein